MPIYTLRTTSGREGIVIDMLSSKIRAEGLPINTVFHPAEIKGYIFIEGNLGAVQKAVKGVMHIRGLIEKPVRLEEIQHFLEYKKERIKVDVGDTVEIIGGPFKGEKGRVNRIDTVKNEVTVELLEASIPIPVTIATEFVKVIKAAKKEEPTEKKPLELRPEPEEKREEGPSEFEKAVEEIKKEEAKPERKPAEEKPAAEGQKEDELSTEPEKSVEEVAKEALKEAKEAEETARPEKEEPSELEKAMGEAVQEEPPAEQPKEERPAEEPEKEPAEEKSMEEQRQPPEEEKPAEEPETKAGGAAVAPEEMKPPAEEEAPEEAVSEEEEPPEGKKKDKKKEDSE